MRSASAIASSYIMCGSSTKWQRAPWNWMSRHFSGLVLRGMTAMNGTPTRWAKYASEIAVEPLDASITGASGRIQPLHRACRNSERARAGA
ncbi:hypothetical protein GCM10020221_12580 [Streptomyces thioluteus]|uniref:Uncharacterized protein n=1 Tax=Streptomyces thioluteus TaxID=66431 RepID=A0ABP6J2E6_STRTU